MAYPSNHDGVDKNSESSRQLKAFIERIERLEEEQRGLADDKKDIYLELKSQGFDAKVVRKVVADRKKDAETVDEFEAMVQTYREAIS